MTPAESAFANAAVTDLIFFVVIPACFAAIGIAVSRGEKAAREEKAGSDIDEAVGLVCKPCSWTDPAAECTCPPRGCTATVCPKRQVRRG